MMEPKSDMFGAQEKKNAHASKERLAPKQGELNQKTNAAPPIFLSVKSNVVCDEDEREADARKAAIPRVRLKRRRAHRKMVGERGGNMPRQEEMSSRHKERVD